MSRNYDKHSLEEYNLAMQLRKKYDCGTKMISEYLSNLGFKVKEGAISGWIYRNKKPFNEVIISKIPESSKELTEEKAYILGVLCGDGYIRTQNSNYLIGVDACDEDMVDEFRRYLEKVYGLTPTKRLRIRKNKDFNCKPQYIVNLSSKLVVQDLLRYCNSFRTKEWKVPQQIKDSSKKIQAHFLKGFFDSEGSIRLRRNGFGELGLTSSNKEALLEIQEILLNNFNVRSKFKIRKIRTVFVLYTYDYKSLNNFYKNIGFVIKRKQDTLVKAINSYKRGSIKVHPFEIKIKAIELLQKGLSHREIAKQLNVNYASIYDWEKRFRIIDRGIEGI